ncbi:unnamed protein product [Arabis nemorensis]|uniref:Uncharacterized protein n=1 Tax=Arabis nemorensis TaxID=586526 RepID=A0A565BTB8_9BRAS|nr:unnamed protein product [Arabis nemorensis]
MEADVCSLYRCSVFITDGDPQPGALVGRMSFQSFNPSIEKLNEEALNGQRTDGFIASCSSKEAKMSLRKIHLPKGTHCPQLLSKEA